jgi:hypothetical protein
VPALTLAERDAAGDELDDQEQAFIWSVVDEVVDNLEETPLVELPTASNETEGEADPTPSTAQPVSILGIAVENTSDALILKMLGQLVGPAGYNLEIIAEVDSPLELAERVAHDAPQVVVLSHLPPEGLTQARYLVKRLRAQFADLPLLVGRWGETGGAAVAATRLSGLGATRVFFTLAEARQCILAAAWTHREPATLVGT